MQLMKSSKQCLPLVLNRLLLTSSSPWGVNDPTEGSRVVLTDPFNSKTSEFGWHSTGTEEYNTLRGNNGIAHNNPSGELIYIGDKYLDAYRPVSEERKFEYPLPANETDWLKYRDASITQLRVP